MDVEVVGTFNFGIHVKDGVLFIHVGVFVIF